jgi:glycosyltransferase involved in cell wall biosynthesis
MLLPSLEETAPVALGEACAVGLPAVGSDAGGIPDMIEDGVTGFIRPAGDDRALAAAVLDILQSDELRRRLAGNARVRGEADFNLDAIARSTVAAYEEILGEVASEIAR